MAARCDRLFRSIYRPLRLLLRYSERYWQCRNDSLSSHVNEFFQSAPKEITTSILYRHCAQLVGERSTRADFYAFSLYCYRRFRNRLARDQSTTKLFCSSAILSLFIFFLNYLEPSMFISNVSNGSNYLRNDTEDR